MADIILLTEERKDFFQAGTEPGLVKLDQASFLSIEGIGESLGRSHRRAMLGLETVAKALSEAGPAFELCPLQCQWWWDQARGKVRKPTELLEAPPEHRRYRMLCMVPEGLKKNDVSAALKTIGASDADKETVQAARQVRFITLKEGPCVQLLHTGSHIHPIATVEALEKFVEDNGLAFDGLHHEVYLSDPRVTEADDQKTIIRFPVRRL